MPKLSFRPKRHGYQFQNRFSGSIGPMPYAGLCGGMCYSVLNYYRAGLPIPLHEGSDFGTPDGVPEEHGSKFRDEIYSWQVWSWGKAANFMYVKWPWENDADYYRRHFQDSVMEFERIASEIDRGRLVVVGLRSRSVGDLFKGHYVIAYGYDRSPRRLWVYDCNFPREEIALHLEDSVAALEHNYDHGGAAGGDSYASLFMQTFMGNGFDPLQPAGYPQYRDLVLSKGVSFSAPAGDGLRQSGEALTVEAEITNQGEFPVTVRKALLWARSPGAVNRDGDLGQLSSSRTIQPGERVSFKKIFSSFNQPPGPYRFGVSVLTNAGEWVVLSDDDVSGTRNPNDLQIVPGIDPGQLDASGISDGKTYSVGCASPGKVLDVDISWFRGQNVGQKLIQWGNRRDTNQQFRLEDAGNGEWRFSPQHATQMCISVDGTGPGLVQASRNTGTDDQKFQIIPVHGRFMIKSIATNLCMTVSDPIGGDGSAIVLRPWIAAHNQLFDFTVL